MSKGIRIGGAFLVATIIIATAFLMKYGAQTQHAASIEAVSNEPGRSYIEGADSDNDGTSDWEEELREMTLRETEDLPLLEVGTSTESDGPSTLTESFARSFFESYVRTDVSGALTDETKDTFLTQSTDALRTQINEVLYTKNDIRVGDDSASYLREYGNTIATIITKHSVDTENEIEILEHALAADDATLLTPLTNIEGAYDAMLTDTLSVAAPEALVMEHVMLTNALLVVRNDIEAMSLAFDDPLYSLLRVKRYQDDVLALYNSFKNIYVYLYEHGVTYADNEPASMFKVEMR